MKITRAVDYALRVVVFMASEEKGKVFMRSGLSVTCDVPDSFLGKILQALAKSGILQSERGKKGGFSIAIDTSSISIYDIVRAVEGDVVMNECLVDENFCKNSKFCSVNSALSKIRENLISDMKKYKISELSAR